MTLIHKRRITKDKWKKHSPHEDTSGEEQIIVALDTVCKDPNRWRERTYPWGLSVGGDSDLDTFSDWLEHISLLEIHIPKFTDGRGYSLAQQVRRTGYSQELRASGDILQDQLAYLERCGFDSFTSDTVKLSQEMLVAFDEISRPYQASGADPDASWRRFG